MLKSPFLEFVRENAPTTGNFRVDLPRVHAEIADEGASVIAGEEGKTITRDYVIDNVVRPLLDLSASTRFHNTTYTEDSFGGEGANLSKILKKDKQQYELLPGVDPVDGFRCFWGGWYGEPGNGNYRGYVLFLINDPNADLSRILSYCYDPGVVAQSSLRSSLGNAFHKSIVKTLEENPQSTAIVLGDRATLGKLTIFPGREVFDKRLKEAISSTRTFDRSKVDDS